MTCRSAAMSAVCGALLLAPAPTLVVPVPALGALPGEDCVEEAELLAGGGLAGDRFGAAAAIGAGTTLVGLPGADRGFSGAGAAEIHVEGPGGWSRSQVLESPAAGAFFEFGRAVALDGDVAVVGEPGARSGGVEFAGAVHVFRRAGSTFSFEATIPHPRPEAFAQFGGALDVHGEVAVVAAAGSASGTGRTYVFRFDGAGWPLEMELTSPALQAGDGSGQDVALHLPIVMVGAPNRHGTGAVDVFEHDGVTWAHVEEVRADDGTPGDLFGSALDLHGTTALVGAQFDDDAAPFAGSAYVFDREVLSFVPRQKLLPADAQASDFFGASVAIGSGLAAVGAPGDDDRATSAGSVHLHELAGGTWSLRQVLVASDGRAFDQAARAVDLDGRHVVFGSTGHDDQGSSSGSAHVFECAGAANAAPIAADDAYTGDENRTLDVPAPGVLLNDRDDDGDPLTAALESPPARGTVTLDPDGSFRYVPETDTCGRDTFTYRASDGVLESNSATVTVDVRCANAPPACTVPQPSYAGGCRRVVIPDATAVDADGDALRFTWTFTDPRVTAEPRTGTLPAGPGARPVPPTVFTLADDEEPCGHEVRIHLVVFDGERVSGCDTVVSFADTEPPEIDGDSLDLRVECPDVPAPRDLEATDGCDDEVEVRFDERRHDGDCPGRYTLVRQYTAVDHCNNAEIVLEFIEVDDTTRPTLSETPADVTVECDAIPTVPGVTASDLCDPDVPVVFAQDTVIGRCANEETITRRWSAADDCGNEVVHEQVIQVRDSRPPVLSEHPVSLDLQCHEDVPPAPPVTATDTCDPFVEVELAEERVPGNCPQAYTLVRTWSAADDCGNAVRHEQVITVRDDEPPQLHGVPADVTVECDAVPGPPDVTASDRCDPEVEAELHEQRIDGPCPGEYEILRTWTAVDACGNLAQDVQVVTVVDTTPPHVVEDTSDMHCVRPLAHGYACFGREDFAPAISDACSPPVSWRFAGCASDQPEDGPGDGTSEDDCVLLDGGEGFCVRAERDARDPAGRRHRVTVVAMDACGNESDPVQVGTVHVPHHVGRGDTCREPSTSGPHDPPTTRTGPGCRALPATWDVHSGIEARLGCPGEGEVRIPRLGVLELTAAGSDEDLAVLRCEEVDADGRVSCASSRNVPAPDPVELRWTLVAGPGELRGDGLEADGPAVLYDPPNDLDRPRVASLRVLADDAGTAQADDRPNRARLQLRVRPDPGSPEHYLVDVRVTRDFDAADDPPEPPQRDCGCRPEEAWRPGPALQAAITTPPEGSQACAGRTILLEAVGGDADELVQRCADGSGDADERLVGTVPDPLSFTWAVTDSLGRPVGRFPCGNVGRRVPWTAPTDLDEIRDEHPNLTITVLVDDSGRQPDDADEPALPRVRPRRIDATVVLVQDVRWAVEAPDHGLLLEDNPPERGGGLRFHPGARDDRERDRSRNRLAAVATVRPAVRGLEVHFRAFDPDDPTAGDRPHPDDVLDPNGPLGRDNRGRVDPAAERPVDSVLRPEGDGYRGRLRPVVSGVPDGPFRPEGLAVTAPTEVDAGRGEARVELATSFAPGDNFRVACGCDAEEVSGMGEHDVPPRHGPELPGFSGRLTPTLYVWRFLHVESDRMANVGGERSSVRGRLLDVREFPPGEGEAELERSDLGPSLQRDQFDSVADAAGVIPGGRIVADGRSFAVLENDAVSPAPGSTAEVRFHLDAGTLPDPDARVTLYDDDFRDPANPEAFEIVLNRSDGALDPADFSLMQTSVDCRLNRFACAYVVPRLDTLPFLHSDPDDPAPEAALVEPSPNLEVPTPAGVRDLVGEAWGTRDPDAETDVFWVAYVTSAYQHFVTKDADPNDEPAGFGVTAAVAGPGVIAVRNGGDLSLLFWEVIRDLVEVQRAGPAGADLRRLAAMTTVHEVGHQFGLDHYEENPRGTVATHDTEGLMRPDPTAGPPEDESFTFTDAELRAIRARRHSPGRR